MNETEANIALQIVRGIGCVTHRRLVDIFGSASDVWRNASAARELEWVPGSVSRALASGPDMKRVDMILKSMADMSGWIITASDSSYPGRLRDIDVSPQVLYGIGKPESLDMQSVAVVGSRKSTAYGRQAARHLAGGLASDGFAVVSGLALGIDSEAHRAAVLCGGVTVAVKGCGLDVRYPRANLELVDSIRERGAVISEFPPGTSPEPRNFPVRNRIISGLSMGVVVVEAARKSGSLITASLAADQGREVMAVPGSIFSSLSSGTHWLIGQGAAIVTSVKDIKECVGGGIAGNICGSEDRPDFPGKGLDRLSDREMKVVEALSDFPVHIDEIAALCEMSIVDLSGIMVQLELQDVVIAMPGQMYCLARRFVNK